MFIVNFHFKDVYNVGDVHSAPLLYFQLPNHQTAVADINSRSTYLSHAIILGGGALLTKVVRRKMKFSGISIVWGAGFTDRDAKAFVPYELGRHDLIGVRDIGTPYEWVPCASCMSPLFDQQYKITREYTIFENTLHAPLRRADLGNCDLDMRSVIYELGSAETVVTSSYHGAYWATLLGRKVLAVPLGSKFHAMKHPPVFTDSERWWEAKGRSWPEALQECRAANVKFADRVRQLLDQREATAPEPSVLVP